MSRTMIEITWEGDEEFGHLLIEEALDSLMATMVASVGIIDPSVNATLRASEPVTSDRKVTVNESDVLPEESMALTVALAQVLRGDDPTPNVAIVCVLALARLVGRHDYTTEGGTDD